MSGKKPEDAPATECLFSTEHFKLIKEKYEDWFKNSLRDDDRATEGKTFTHSGIPIKLIYTPADVENINYLEDIGFSGHAPYIRGVYPNMYRGRMFTVRQLAGLGAPGDCNERVCYLLYHGATGVNILFDLPTIRGYNSDDPEAEDNVGQCGASPEYYVKASLGSAFLYPRLAVVDPELTHTLPPAVTASTGLDALTQLIEPFVSANANPLTDALCKDGMARVARSLRRAWEDGRNATAREDMALASLLGGLALANARLGAVHGCAAVLGGRYPAPHGAVCARLLPFVMAANVAALHDRSTGGPALRRYEEVERILTGRSAATIADGIRWVHALSADLGIPPLGRHGACSPTRSRPSRPRRSGPAARRGIPWH